uniref:Uncharacterized protein n=1 Tax=Strongyloides papillosus TaxID=174720 RepID=A0A0N5C7T8_STREA
MQYQLHPNAWVAVDYNTAMRKDDTDDKVTKNFVTEFKESKQQSTIEEIYEDNNNRKIYSSKNNDVYLIKKGRKNTRDQRFSRSIRKSSSISKKVDRKYTYTVLVPYFLIILYYRSYLEIYHISTMDSK